MKKEDFLKILDSKFIAYKLKDDIIDIDNQGYVDLESLTDEKIITVDGSSMRIINERKKEDFTIYFTEYMGMVHLDNKIRYIAKRGKYFAHGESVKEAIKDVQFKYMQEEMDIEAIVKNIKTKGYFEINDYRLVTGACSVGCKDFLSSKNVTLDKMPIKDVISLTKGAYGFEYIKEYFSEFLQKST